LLLLTIPSLSLILSKQKLSVTSPNLFQDSTWDRPNLSGGDFKRLNVESTVELEKMVTIEEVKDVMWSCDSSKIDFQKVFDSILWHYILWILDHMGFNKTWQLWIKQCISTTRMAILIIGSLSTRFVMGKGIQQCGLCHISYLLCRAVSQALLSGFHLGGILSISNIQYVDDTIIFCPLDYI